MSTEIQVLADITRVHAAQRSQQTAIFYDGRETTFAELDRRASRVANGLVVEGLARQTRVALLDKNSDEFYEILFGAAKATCVLVPINWRLAAPEIAYIVNDSGAEVLFVGPDFFDLTESLRPELKQVKMIIALGSPHPEWRSYPQWRDRQSETEPDSPSDGSEVGLQMYTSGTTGYPKGVQLTSDNLLALLHAGVSEWGTWSDRDVNLAAMPQFHVGGCNWGLVSLYVGATTVIAREFVPAEVLRLIAQLRVTRTFLVPAAILFLLQTPSISETDLSSLDEVLFGASPMPEDLLRQAVAVFKCGFAQTYGMTETTGGITYMPPQTEAGGPRPRSCGKPFSSVELRIVDPFGRDLPPGEVGEIICRTRANMKGYWNLPGETAKTIRDGWLYTGDAGYLDEEGYLYIHDRVKDMIITGGENVYPAEVESVLFSHPAVADVAVIGIPDDTWGEAVLAIVVKKPGAEVTADDIIAFARERIAHYKAPRWTEFTDSLPRNPSGKILKRKLREPYWAGRERKV